MTSALPPASPGAQHPVTPTSDSHVTGTPGETNSFAGRDTATVDQPAQLSGHQRPAAPGKGLDERKAASAGNNSQLPSVKGSEADQLKAQKADLLKKADEALTELGQGSLIDQAIGALNGSDGGSAAQKQELIITVEPPPDFKPVNVFPPDPSLSPEDLKKYQGIALAALNGYKAKHPLPDDGKQALQKVVSDSKAELTKLQARFTELKVEGEDGPAELEKLKGRAYSFELKDEEGNVSLKPVANPSTDDVKKAYQAKEQGAAEAGSDAAKPAQPGQRQRQGGQAVPQPGNVPPPPPPPVSLKAEAMPPIQDIQRGPADITSPAISFLGQSSESQYAPIYKTGNGNPGDDAAGNIASMNAGDKKMYLGGGTINGAHASAISQSTQLQVNAFEPFHNQVLKLKTDDRGFKVPQAGGIGAPHLAYTIAKEGDPETKVGSAFVHIFKQGQCPYGDDENRSMVYIVPPNGAEYSDRDQFLAAVQATAFNTFETLQEYNVRASQQDSSLPLVETFRVCRFSSDGYVFPGLDGKEVALAIQRGFQQAADKIKNDGHKLLVKELQYEDGKDKNFSSAGIQGGAGRVAP
ncbi:hypothetical protein M3P05_18130 [Sansalvadorimonas sp. 2012CJ34-2]|uniref:Uncharacterized protein n=1 Tax=Parendozoicomonas callyspongiae TaxID=2942213 RepID=A0ABT0PKC3_9GAMM|nr:hypothetical protein [Sansalvadorimonas sp. 2012CJ34-2]MCL6271842.1 hypothetical protein [Sansalvadorimonas sp. 2012CJ34-2]